MLIAFVARRARWVLAVALAAAAAASSAIALSGRREVQGSPYGGESRVEPAEPPPWIGDPERPTRITGHVYPWDGGSGSVRLLPAVNASPWRGLEIPVARDGSFDFGLLPAGEYVLIADSSREGWSRAVRVRTDVVATNEWQDGRDVDLVLARCGRRVCLNDVSTPDPDHEFEVRGRVVDERDHAVVGALVEPVYFCGHDEHCADWWPTASETVDDGAFSIQLHDVASFRVSINGRKWSPSTAADKSGITLRLLGRGAAAHDVIPRAVVRGRVTCRSAAVADAQVGVNETLVPTTTWTLHDGAFSLALPDGGDFVLRIDDASRGISTAVPVHVDRGAVVEGLAIDVSCARAS